MLVPTLLAHSMLGLTAPMVGASGPDTLPAPIDFTAIDRKIKSEPDYVAKPRYGLFLFGEDADVRVWAVLDKSAADAVAYDVLYIDRDADGVIGEDGERVEGKVKGKTEDSATAVFDIGDFAQPTLEASDGAPGTAPKKPVVHEAFKVTWTKDSVRYRMMWNGDTVTMGTFGPTRETYASFGESPKTATVLVPGFDRPLEFDHWMCGTLPIGEEKSFKVFLGARGSERGAFSCGDQKLLPAGEHVLATLIYESDEGDEKRVLYKLRERC